jgi:hypothetical protein
MLELPQQQTEYFQTIYGSSTRDDKKVMKYKNMR